MMEMPSLTGVEEHKGHNGHKDQTIKLEFTSVSFVSIVLRRQCTGQFTAIHER